MRAMGLDLGLKAVGYADANGQLGTITPPRDRRGWRRLVWLRDQIADVARTTAALVIAVEGYSFASSQGAHQLGEIGGVARAELGEHGFVIVDIPPTTLKKYAVGTAKNVTKLQVALAAQKRLKVEPADDHQADASWLRAMVLDAAGEPLVSMPAAHRAALAGVAWPDADELEAGHDLDAPMQRDLGLAWPGLEGLR